MSSESPKTIFSVFIMFDSVLSQSCSSDTALSNLGHGDAFSETTNITLCEKGLEVFSEMFDMSSRYWGKCFHHCATLVFIILNCFSNLPFPPVLVHLLPQTLFFTFSLLETHKEGVNIHNTIPWLRAISCMKTSKFCINSYK